jgi:hypothetical protein
MKSRGKSGSPGLRVYCGNTAGPIYTPGPRQMSVYRIGFMTRHFMLASPGFLALIIKPKQHKNRTMNDWYP